MQDLSSISLSSSYLELMLDYALQLGCDLSQRMLDIGITDQQLNDSFARISYAMEAQLLESALEHTGDRCFGLHMGEKIRPRFMGSLGYASMSSATLGDAINLLLEYHKISSELADFHREDGDNTIALVWRSEFAHIPHYRHRVEASFSSAICFGRWITGTDNNPRMITFSYAEPQGGIGEYERIFRCPVRFNQPRSSILLDKPLLALPLVDADPEVHRIMTNRMRKEIAIGSHRATVREQVTLVIEELLSETTPSLEVVADTLKMKPWTLRRRLQQDGVDFSSLLDAVRQRRATDMLLQSDVPVAQIAIDLGYSEQSAFNRAFRRWFGMTPVEYRNQGNAQKDENLTP